MAHIRNTAVACALATAALCLPATAPAAVNPGVPLAVGPGVPSHGRAWELVSSPDPVAPVAVAFSTAPDGGAVAYKTWGPLPGFPTGEQLFPQTLGLRGASGWTVQQPGGAYPELLTSTSQVPELKAFGPGDETGIWTGPLPSSNRQAIFLRAASGGYSLLQEDAEFEGASADFRRFVFSSQGHFLPADSARTVGESLYESDAGSLRLLDTIGDGTPISTCGVRALGVYGDATRVYFTPSPVCNASLQITRVYLAERGLPTREVSVSRCTTNCGSPASVDFYAASSNGAHALLETEQKLTDDDSNLHRDLYRYDVADDNLSLVSSRPGAPDLLPLNIRRGPLPPAWISPDGARSIFFGTDPAVMPENGLPPESEIGIYLAYENGVHRLADVETTELVDVSPDGRYILLNSTLPLAPGDSDGQADTYRYDASNGDFLRLSQGPVGGNGPWPANAKKDGRVVDSVIQFHREAATGAGVVDPTLRFRAMSDDGSRAFFVTDEQLVSQDTDGTGDVYEWAEGDVGLVSAGSGSEASTLLGATPDGATAFILTADTLVPGDRDGGESDIYAARIGGGFPETSSTTLCPCGHGTPARQALDRSDPASARPPAGHVTAAPPSAAALRRFGKSGWIELLAEVPGSGRLSVEAKARMNSAVATVASTGRRVTAAGPVQLRMRLSKAARRWLARGAALQVRVSMRLSGYPGAGNDLSFRLERSR